MSKRENELLEQRNICEKKFFLNILKKVILCAFLEKIVMG